MDTEELTRLTTSPSRRVIGVGALLGLGALFLYMAFAMPPADFLWQAFLVACGLASLALAHYMWKSTAHSLILTERGLIDSDGTEVALIEDIDKVDRGTFALKPSNGFVILLKTPGPRVWRPGLWWRLGRRVAIGGVTAAAQTKPLADILTMKVMERDGKMPR